MVKCLNFSLYIFWVGVIFLIFAYEIYRFSVGLSVVCCLLFLIFELMATYLNLDSDTKKYVINEITEVCRKS